ncbi:MAG: hypothetical protein ACRCU2_04780 [Planktothrix sp.]
MRDYNSASPRPHRQRTDLGNDLSRGRPPGTRHPQRAILFSGERLSTPAKPTPELIAFCQKLTREIAVAFLTDEPLEAPLKGFPPT